MKEKRNWENRFQHYIDRNHSKDCGKGSMCKYCKGKTDVPCISAFNKMIRDKKLTIDYKSLDLEKAWKGEL